LNSLTTTSPQSDVPAVAQHRPPGPVFSDEERTLIARDLTPAEAIVAMRYCTHLGLDPLVKQVSFVVYHARDAVKRRMVPIVGIDGWRRWAIDTGEYEGTTDPTLLVEDSEGKIFQVPYALFVPAKHKIISATVTAHRRGYKPYPGTAIYEEYAGPARTKSRDSTSFYDLYPAHMLLKVAEKNALSHLFSLGCAGVYLPEEMPAIAVEFSAVPTEEPPHRRAPDKKTHPTTPPTEDIQSIFATGWAHVVGLGVPDDDNYKKIALEYIRGAFGVKSWKDIPPGQYNELRDWLATGLVEEFRRDGVIKLKKEEE